MNGLSFQRLENLLLALFIQPNGKPPSDLDEPHDKVEFLWSSGQ
ncbi:hypothetical protein HPL003_19315 [Paenibacillus terrae HPL-003]|uniref:Uncharacterized protein n=1 Tax=Paenibacillus terrae (strain HPL-003) TaxID=985665 RepID=G7W2U7_PAETH|nr:hypothetical protein HPL003_19315 [Paenibacillus terrae HPL-003]